MIQAVQYDLFGKSLDQRFVAWLQSPAGAQIEREVISRALDLRAAGFTRYGIKAICEALRFDRHLHWGPETDAGDPYRVNNVYTSRLARHIMAAVPDLAGFFEVRELLSRSDRSPRRALVVPIQSRCP